MRRLLLVVLTAAGLLGPGPGPAAGAPVDTSNAVEVRLAPRIEDPDRPYSFDPEEIVIEASATVRWVNDDDVFHTITSTDSLERLVPNDFFRERLSRRGQSVELRFDAPGVYAYYCQPHADFMVDQIRVVGAPDGGHAGSSDRKTPQDP